MNFALFEILMLYWGGGASILSLFLWLYDRITERVRQWCIFFILCFYLLGGAGLLVLFGLLLFAMSVMGPDGTPGKLLFLMMAYCWHILRHMYFAFKIYLYVTEDCLVLLWLVALLSVEHFSSSVLSFFCTNLILINV